MTFQRAGALAAGVALLVFCAQPVQAQAPGTQIDGFTTSGAISGTPAIGPDGTLYFGSDDGFLRAVAPAGTPWFPAKWQFNGTGPIQASPSVGGDGTVYFGTVNGRFFALTPSPAGTSATVKWSNFLGDGGQVYASPALAADGTVYVATFGLSTLYAFNPATGHTNWQFTPFRAGFDSYLYSSPAIGVDGTIYLGSHNRTLYALNPNRTVKWTFNTDRRIDSSPAIALDGTIYVATGNPEFPRGTLYSLNPDGSKRWEFTVQGGIQSSPAIDEDGTIYFGSFDGRFYALTPNGTVKWSFNTGFPIWTSPAIGSDGTVYFSTDDTKNSFLALTSTGVFRWNFFATDFIHGSPTIRSDGAVVFGSLDNSLYAVAGQVGIRRPQWSMFRGNPRHTGRSPFILKFLEPQNGRTFLAPAAVPLLAEAQSSEGTVSVAFFQRRTGDPSPSFTFIDSTNRPPFLTTWNVAIPGEYTLYARVLDGIGNSAESPRVVINVSGVNTPPTIQAIPPQNGETGTTLQIPFRVNDDITAIPNLTGRARADDTNILTPENAFVSFTSTNGLMTLNLSPTGVGTTRVTLTVADEAGLESSVTFELNVQKINFPPEISPPDGPVIKTTLEDTPITLTNILVYDRELDGTPPRFDLLVLEAGSSDPNLVPPQNITFGGTGIVRGATILPGTNRFGEAKISLIVTDPEGASAQTEFTLRVLPVNDPPEISSLGDIAITNGQPRTVAFTIGDVDTPIELLTLTKSTANPALIPDSGLVFGGTSSNRTLRITPAPNAVGTNRVTIIVNDGNFGFATNSFNVILIRPNTAPTISAITSRSILEDASTGPIGFTVGDAETPAEALTVQAIASNPTLLPASAIVLGGSGANRTLTLNPATNQFGSATVTVSVSDGELTASTTFTLTVTAVPDPPFISDIANRTIREDTDTGIILFTIGDPDTPPSALTLSASSSNTKLVPLLNIDFGGSGADRTVTVTPMADQSGITIITITVSDGALTASDSFTLTVTEEPDAPTISVIANVTIAEDTVAGPIAFAINDVDTAVTSLMLSAASSDTTLLPAARVVFGGSGNNRTLTATPATNQFGSTIIAVVVSDGVLSATNRFTLTVTNVNDAPFFTSTLTNMTAPRGTLSLVQPFSVGDIDDAPGSLSVSVLSSNPGLLPAAATNAVVSGSGANRTLTLYPVAGQTGQAAITLIVADPAGARATNAFALTVQQVAEAPSISAIPNQTTREDQPTAPIGFVIGDLETPANLLRLSAASSNTQLLPVTNIVFSGTSSNRTLTLTPAPDQSGRALVTLFVADEANLTNSTTFVLDVEPVNDAPIIDPLNSFAIDEDTPAFVVSFVVRDVDTPLEFVRVTANSSNPSLLPDANLTVAGTSSQRSLTVGILPDRSGEVTVTLVADDQAGGRSTNAFTLLVLDIEDAPTLAGLPAAVTTPEDVATPPIPFTIGDSETPAAQLRLSAASSNPSLIPTANIVFSGTESNRTVVLRPATNQFGSAIITIAVADASASTNFATLTLTVTAVNDPPVAMDDAFTIAEDTPLSIPASALLANDVDVDGPLLAVTAVSNPQNGIATLIGQTVTFVPATNFNGRAEFTYTLSDGIESTTARAVITVEPLNDSPTISSIPNQATAEDIAVGPLPFLVFDVETDASQLQITITSSNTKLLPVNRIILGGAGQNRTITLNPIESQSGVTTIEISVSDGSLTAETSFTLTVSSVNDAPIISAIADQTIPENAAAGPIAFTIRDAETPAADLQLTATSSNPGLIPLTGIAFGGAGTDRTVTLRPLPGRHGSAVITIVVTDAADLSASESFILTVADQPDPPSISSIPPQTMDEDTVSPPIAFVVFDPDEPLVTLPLRAMSSAPELIPATNIVFGGSLSNRTLVLRPLTNQFGTATITIVATDSTGLTNAAQFPLTVRPVNDAPFIVPVNNLRIDEGTPPFSVLFTVGDIDTPLGQVTVTPSSSNPALLPDSGLRVSGTTGTRSLRIQAAPGVVGGAVITLIADDGSGGRDTNSFTLEVRAAAPVVTTGPVAHTAYESDAHTFTGAATGTPPLAYQWLFNGAPIAGATNAAHTLARILLADAGEYALRVANAAGTAMSAPARLTVLPLPSLTGSAQPVPEGDRVNPTLEFVLTLSVPIPRTVSVRYATASGTALAGEDFEPAGGLAVFPPNTTQVRVAVTIRADTTFEPDESFFLELSSATNATIATARIAATILNDDLEASLGPSVAITSPATGSAFTAPAEIGVTATAAAPGSAVTRVEFYAGTTQIGARTALPYSIVWTNTAVGTYTLTARAFDASGLAATSNPVRILVSRSAATAAVAIVRNIPHADIDRIQDYLLELGLTSQLFDRDGLTLADLDGFQMVVWHDGGSPGLAAADVALFQQLAQSTTALYFIGERLASAGAALPAANRAQWSALTLLTPGVERLAPEIIQVNAASSHPAVNGRFGIVGNFVSPSGLDRATASGTEAVTLATAAGSVIAAALDRESGLGRVMSQNTLVAGGADPASIAERKKLFKNAVAWLLRKGFAAFTDLSLALAAPSGPIPAGQEVTLTWTLRQRGEVEASGVSLSIGIPPQFRFLRGEFTQGDLQPFNGGVVYSPGNMESAAAVTLKITCLASSNGRGSFAGTINGNEPDPNPANNAAAAELEVLGSVSQPARLLAARVQSGRFEFILEGTQNASYNLEVSTDLVTWTPIATLTLTGSTASFVDPTPPTARRRYYRARAQ